MEYMDKLKKKACKALEDLTGSNDLELMKDSHRSIVKDLICIIKDVEKIEDMEGEEYSNSGYSGKHYVRAHYSRAGGDGMSMAGRHRNSMGQYSRTDAKREMLDHLESAMAAAPDEITRNMARDFYDKVDRA